MQPISFYTQIIENEIKGLSLAGDPVSLYEPVSYMLAMGGKRIRPALTLMANEMFAGDLKKAIKPALAIEMFHNFTLVHDDIMDHSPIRRGSKTVHKKWNEETAILSGDVMLVLAYDLLTEVGSDKLLSVINLFNDFAKKVCEGQQLDMIFENAPRVSTDQYIDMIGRKTGVLFAGSLKMGAIIAGSNETDAMQLYQFGYNAGIAFQIQDDILDTYGQEGKVGKTIGGDIASNKKTFLAVRAFELAAGTILNELEYLVTNNLSSKDQKIDKTISIFNSLSVRDQAEQARDKYYSRAMESLEKINAKEADKQALRNVAEMLINREN